MLTWQCLEDGSLHGASVRDAAVLVQFEDEFSGIAGQIHELRVPKLVLIEDLLCG